MRLYQHSIQCLACVRLSDSRDDAYVKQCERVIQEKRAVAVKRKREGLSPLPSFLPFHSRVRAFSISGIGLSRSLEQATQCFNWYPDTSKSVCAAPNFSTHFDNILMSDKTLRAVIIILLIAQCKPRNTQDQPFLLVSWEPSVATYKGIHRWQGHLDRKKDHTATSHT